MTPIAFTPAPLQSAEPPAGHTKANPTRGTKAPSSCRGDWANAMPPVWFLCVVAGACLFALLAADAIYSAFFDWMVTR